MSDNLENQPKIVIFKNRQIRRVLHNDEWWFSVIDVIEVLTESNRPRKYWSDLKSKLINEGYTQLSENIGQLKMEADDGKLRKTDAANTENLLRIVQSVPSPRAEPFKRWLAKVGYERIQEIEDPELASMRARGIYKSKGYSDGWIEKRMRSIVIRDELTEEWQKRGVKENLEYAILTAEISKATFGMTPSEYKQHKNLQRENLRDNMTDLELIFSMLGEASTTEIARNKDTQGFHDNKKAAQDGGTVAGNARRELEEKSGKRVITKDNFLALLGDEE